MSLLKKNSIREEQVNKLFDLDLKADNDEIWGKNNLEYYSSNQ